MGRKEENPSCKKKNGLKAISLLSLSHQVTVNQGVWRSAKAISLPHQVGMTCKNQNELSPVYELMMEAFVALRILKTKMHTFS